MKPPPVLVDIRTVARPGQPLPDDVLYIGRRAWRGGWSLPESYWHNPYSVNRYGIDMALRRYAIHATYQLRGRLEELTGMRLACWCRGDANACHGGILIDLWQTYCNTRGEG